LRNPSLGNGGHGCGKRVDAFAADRVPRSLVIADFALSAIPQPNDPHPPLVRVRSKIATASTTLAGPGANKTR
jgi:hypothetical protein